MAVLTVAGLQVPVMPLFDVVASTGAVALRQSDPIGLKTGVTIGLTITVTVALVAHWPASGVKV
jgi:hypothetical protein